MLITKLLKMKEKRISGGIDCCGVGELNKEEKETII